MAIIHAFLIVVEVVTSALLIGVIFLQKSKGSGMGTAFGGMGEAIFGTRMGNVLTKATVVLGVTFLVNTTLLAWLGARPRVESVVDRNPIEAPLAPTDGGPGTMPVSATGPDGGAGTEAVDFGTDAATGGDVALPAGESTAVVEIPAATDDSPAPTGSDMPSESVADGPDEAAPDADTPPSAQ